MDEKQRVVVFAIAIIHIFPFNSFPVLTNLVYIRANQSILSSDSKNWSDIGLLFNNFCFTLFYFINPFKVESFSKLNN